MTALLEGLSAEALGERLGGLSPEGVKALEGQRRLFSIIRPKRNNQREYPAFQAVAGIRGEPLRLILEILSEGGGSAAYGFFTSPTEALGGLCPIEVLTGEVDKDRLALDHRAAELRRFLGGDHKSRLNAVLAATKDYAADIGS